MHSERKSLVLWNSAVWNPQDIIFTCYIILENLWSLKLGSFSLYVFSECKIGQRWSVYCGSWGNGRRKKIKSEVSVTTACFLYYWKLHCLWHYLVLQYFSHFICHPSWYIPDFFQYFNQYNILLRREEFALRTLRKFSVYLTRLSKCIQSWNWVFLLFRGYQLKH